ncbi:MAG: hypothetical protein HQ580_06600 [Planctomycetes bacterium]|nr:hypothetical protein [Planctomycetota bacterium]
MDNKKSEFSEIVADMSQFAGALSGAAVVAGKKLIRYVNDLTIVDTVLEPPADEKQKSEAKSSKINTEVN